MKQIKRTCNPSLRSAIFLSNHGNVQATSVSSPVRQIRAERAQILSKENRRATLGPNNRTEKHASTRASRVDKCVPGSRIREPSKADALVQNLKYALDVKKNQLADYAHNALVDTEDEHLADLDKIGENVSKHMNLVSEVETIVNTPIGNEMLANRGKHIQKDGEPAQDFTLDNSMTEFRNEVHEVLEELGSLWNEWAEVQAGILGLTVEVLGEQCIDVEQHNLSGELTKSISDADNKHKVHEDRFAEAGQSMDDIKADLATLCDGTTKMVKVQQKTWRAERNKMLDSIKEAMANFEKSK